jgi:hypothetical protein
LLNGLGEPEAEREIKKLMGFLEDDSFTQYLDLDAYDFMRDAVRGGTEERERRFG